MLGFKFNGKGGSLSKQLTVSKQVTDIWHTAVMPERTVARTALTLLLAFVLHCIPFLLPEAWFQSSKDSSPRADSVRVRIQQSERVVRESNTDVQQQQSTTNKTKKKEKSPDNRILTATQATNESTSPRVEVPRDELRAVTQEPENFVSPAKGALPQETISPLLPAGKYDFISKQRHLGEVMGAGAIAGDIEIPDIISEKNPNDPVTRTEYTFAGYFDSLSRRFVEAWGGVRSLPPQARFEGKVGEFIEYDVVINRDGTLRKIVNISAKREPYRDFAAVDELVQGVFRTMFPFQPVPARIRNDPLVIRKRIQFVGFKYTLY